MPIAEIQLISRKKNTQCMKTGCDREKVSWELFETPSGQTDRFLPFV